MTNNTLRQLAGQDVVVDEKAEMVPLRNPRVLQFYAACTKA